MNISGRLKHSEKLTQALLKRRQAAMIAELTDAERAVVGDYLDLEKRWGVDAAKQRYLPEEWVGLHAWIDAMDRGAYRPDPAPFAEMDESQIQTLVAEVRERIRPCGADTRDLNGRRCSHGNIARP